jgi:hypothetical protein
MEYFTNDPNADRINRLKGEMSQVSLNELWLLSLEGDCYVVFNP